MTLPFSPMADLCLVLVTNKKYVYRLRLCFVRLLFIVSTASAEIQLDIQSLLIAMRKSIRNARLGTVKHDWASII